MGFTAACMHNGWRPWDGRSGMEFVRTMGLFRKRKKEQEPLCSAVIVAAGNSSRMGLDKVMAEVGGVPVIVRCIEAFQQAPSVAEVVVVTKEELVPEIIIGPESTQSRSILQDYLRDNGLKELAERVSLSQCPLRRSLS